MSNNNIINNEESPQSQLEDSKLDQIDINFSNELNNHNLNLALIESQNNCRKATALNTIPQKDEIELLKQNLTSKITKTKKNPNKQELNKESKDESLNPYIASNKLKEKKILELLEIINQYESQISSLNNQIAFLTNKNKQMKEIIKNIEFDFEQTKVNLMTEKEVNKNNNAYLTNLYQDKIISEQKIKELINIVNQYSSQIDMLKKTSNEIKNENITYKKENEEYKNNLNQINEKNLLLENDNKKYNEEITQLKEDNKKLCEIQYNTENKMKKNIEENEKIKAQIKINENKYDSLLYTINQDLKSLSTYFETKYNTLLNDHNEINDNQDEIKLSLLFFQNCDENSNKDIDINMQLLIKTLINGFNNSKNKIKDLKIKNNNLNDKLLSIINKEKDYIKQIEQLNKSISDKGKLINQFNNEIIGFKNDKNNNRQNNINSINANIMLEKKIRKEKNMLMVHLCLKENI